MPTANGCRRNLANAVPTRWSTKPATCLYPNVYLMDQFSTQIRVIRPIAVDKTEVTIWCFAPKGESDRQSAANPPVRGFL